MRRVDVFTIGIGVFLGGGIIYLLLQWLGVESLNAGIWTQGILVMGLIIWSLTYFTRVLTKNTTYHQQRKEYEDAMLTKRLEEMSPEELAKLQAEIEKEKK